jgi:hypothetical protein
MARPRNRPALATAGALTVVGAAITGHLVMTVIVRLFDDQLTDAERDRLVAHWHRATRYGWRRRAPGPRCWPPAGRRTPAPGK